MIKPISSIHAWFILGFMTLVIPVYASGQLSTSRLKQEANDHFEAGHYRTAIRLYRQGGLDHSANKKLRLRIGICLYEINDLDSAIRIFQSLIDEGKTEADVYLYMGKSYQTKYIFPNAITFYKKFIEKTSPDNQLRVWAKDELTRCANGARLKFGSEEAYVENAGTSLNTQYAEFGVKSSPTTIDKIYFNSNRVNRDPESELNNNVDIFSATIVNGRWSTPNPLPPNINSTAYEEVCGFSTDGQIIYYLAPVGNEFGIKTDTFSGQEGIVYQGLFSGPYRPENGGTDIAFFNDTICLFASDAPGGYGGYDLYISIHQNGSWSKAVNLGATINSYYNERFPFLTKNGQTLFFSSDNLKSVGGFDIFRSVFDPKQLNWSLPENLGFPVNSALDDTHMIISSDGMTGYMNSNRKEGYGESDIYRVYFKQPIQANQEISVVPTFYQIILLNGIDQVISEQSIRLPEMKEYYLSHLFIDENGDVLSPQNIKKLELLANLLLIYPKIKAELSGFELPSGQRTFSLYFSIKQVEKAAEYLQQKGIQRDRLLLKGYGSSFPLALDQVGSQHSAVFLKLNHRLEIDLHDIEGEPVITHIESIPVPEGLRDPHGVRFLSLRHSMYYSVQIASLTQILQNPSLEAADEMFIEVDNIKGYYRYMAGMLPSYHDAEKKQIEMITAGFTDAFIVPYFNGLRIKPEDIPGIALEYPDLLFYLAKSKK